MPATTVNRCPAVVTIQQAKCPTPTSAAVSLGLPRHQRSQPVTFLDTPVCNFVIPGDPEVPAWKELLKNAFRARLSSTHVFFASHHGRTKLYCKPVVDHCNPDDVVFSDEPAAIAAQEETDTYARHPSDIILNGRAAPCADHCARRQHFAGSLRRPRPCDSARDRSHLST